MTNINDVTADNMVICDDSKNDDSMLRPPGPPIGSIVYGNNYIMPH